MGIEQFGTVNKESYILLVEDDPDHAELALLALERNGIGNKVVVARSGAEAFSRLYEPEVTALPDFVLLDLKLPGIGGLDVLRRIREEKTTKHVPVIILSSSDEESDLLRSYELGVNSYIRKPVSFSQFIEAARQVGVYWLSLNRSPSKDCIV